MKKLLIMVCMAMVAIPCYGDTITFDNLTSFNDLTVPIYNNTLNKLYVKVNTNIQSDNIADGSIMSDDFATASNPLVRDNDNIGEYVKSDLDLNTGDDGAVGVDSGVAYTTGPGNTLHRVVTASSSTYDNFPGWTTGTTNYIYLDYAGKFTARVDGVEQSNTILLGTVVVTAGGTISSVDESSRQTTPPNMRIYQDFVQGLAVSGDSNDTDVVTIGRGTIDFGSSVTIRRNTSALVLDFDDDLDTDGTVQSSEGFYYIWAYPNTSNTSNYAGVLSASSSTVTTVDDERLIGWCYLSGAAAVSSDSVGSNKAIGSAAPNIVHVEGTSNVITSATTAEQVELAKFYSSGRPVEITFTNNVSASNAGDTIFSVISIDSVGYESSVSAIDCENDASDGRGTNTSKWAGNLGAGEHTVQAKWWNGTGANEIRSWSRMLIIEEK